MATSAVLAIGHAHVKAARSRLFLAWPAQDNAVLARGFLDMKREIQITLLHLCSWRQFHFRPL